MAPETLPYDATDDDAYCEGDRSLEELDPSDLTKLQGLINDVQAVPEGSERNAANLWLLMDLYGDDLELL